MKYTKYVFVILLSLVIMIICGVNALAMETGFSTEEYHEDTVDKDTFIKNVNISMLTEEPHRNAIECFDVNENGEIAIGCGEYERKTVCIYTSDGDFKYGYSFECSGSFGIELNGDILNIYLVRSDAAISVDSTGEVKSVLEILDTTENRRYWNYFVRSTKRTIGDKEYTIKNDVGFLNILILESSYSQLVITDKNGEETIIYDVNSAQLLRMTVELIATLAFVGFVVISVIRYCIRVKRGG